MGQHGVCKTWGLHMTDAKPPSHCCKALPCVCTGAVAVLLLPSVQVNMRADQPPPEDNDMQNRKIPLNAAGLSLMRLRLPLT